MLKQVNQPFDNQKINDGIVAVNAQIKDLLSYAQSDYSETVYNQLFHSSETLLNTETADMFVDDLIGHLECLVNTRDAISHHIQTYQQELNARLNKILRSVASYVPVKSEEQALYVASDVAVNTTVVNNVSVDNAPVETQAASKPASRTRGSNKNQG